jgi:hypothetical protein
MDTNPFISVNKMINQSILTIVNKQIGKVQKKNVS